MAQANPGDVIVVMADVGDKDVKAAVKTERYSQGVFARPSLRGRIRYASKCAGSCMAVRVEQD